MIWTYVFGKKISKEIYDNPIAVLKTQKSGVYILKHGFNANKGHFQHHYLRKYIIFFDKGKKIIAEFVPAIKESRKEPPWIKYKEYEVRH